MRSLKKKCRVLKECEMNPTMKRQQFRTKIFSVHGTATKVPKRLTTASNEGESSEETNDSDEEADPWRALIDEATAELHTKHIELVQSFENEGFSKIDAKKQAFAAILPELRKELGNVYMDRLQWMSQLKRDPVHRKIMKTRDAFVAEDEFDPDEALVAAVKERISLGTYVRRIV